MRVCESNCNPVVLLAAFLVRCGRVSGRSLQPVVNGGYHQQWSAVRAQKNEERACMRLDALREALAHEPIPGRPQSARSLPANRYFFGWSDGSECRQEQQVIGNLDPAGDDQGPAKTG